jgi:hypothetical protein
VNNRKAFFNRQAGIVMMSAVALISLTGCVGYVDRPGAAVYMAPPVLAVGVQDNYVYYPSYGIYFNSYRNQYAYQDGGVWVSRPEPIGVSADVLLASPSVRMDFHDSPANHYAEMARLYPRNWAPSGGRQVENRQVPRSGIQKTEAQKAQARKAPAPKTKPKTEKQEEHGDK